MKIKASEIEYGIPFLLDINDPREVYVKISGEPYLHNYTNHQIPSILIAYIDVMREPNRSIPGLGTLHWIDNDKSIIPLKIEQTIIVRVDNNYKVVRGDKC